MYNRMIWLPRTFTVEGELEVHEFYSATDVRDVVTFCVAISSPFVGKKQH